LHLVYYRIIYGAKLNRPDSGFVLARIGRSRRYAFHQTAQNSVASYAGPNGSLNTAIGDIDCHAE
jgi:hypothetical protein